MANQSSEPSPNALRMSRPTLRSEAAREGSRVFIHGSHLVLFHSAIREDAPLKLGGVLLPVTDEEETKTITAFEEWVLLSLSTVAGHGTPST